MKEDAECEEGDKDGDVGEKVEYDDERDGGIREGWWKLLGSREVDGGRRDFSERREKEREDLELTREEEGWHDSSRGATTLRLHLTTDEETMSTKRWEACSMSPLQTK